MEQETVFDLGNYDERTVSMNETPRDALHYLQQVAVSRARCAQVVRAKTIPEQAVSTVSMNFIDVIDRPSEWSVKKCDKFSMQRSLVDAQRPHCNKITNVRWPNLGGREGWRNFCLKQRNNAISLKAEDIPKFAHHHGNPPTLRLLLSLSENQVNVVIQFLIQIFIEEGYTRPLFEWIYALLLVLQKPLLHDVCSSLRELAKHSRFLRSTLENNTEDGPTWEEFSLFIAIVGVYFEQKDIADQASKTTIKNEEN